MIEAAGPVRRAIVRQSPILLCRSLGREFSRRASVDGQLAKPGLGYFRNFEFRQRRLSVVKQLVRVVIGN
jgi:hypothetical protein